ncbi:DUF7221 family queuine tRNA-ribosyltransferase-like protein [Streptomyces hoynatensis]|uniref:deazapurine DNA modification protein DpdA family protein n=1 Tax=Streptomyces hoynatensis TaxID=1141874 RepID=UPI001882B732|nr:hypothetical protein [Streptomyces hoynatensis]
MSVLFYLGTHHPAWLATAGVPLFVSHRRLKGRKGLPRAASRWALDSGGFTELSMHGAWTVPPREYAAAVRRYAGEIGQMAWAAPQDWMCEPWIVAKTGLPLSEHLARTVGNYLDLKSIDPALKIIPVIQGWRRQDYEDCADRYERAGIDLAAEPVVGLGSVCRRQATGEAAQIVGTLAGRGYRLHGFGFKVLGLAECGSSLTSADSLAWSFEARRRPPLPGCSGHKNCANCLRYAHRWRERVLKVISCPRPHQLAFDIAWEAA